MGGQQPSVEAADGKTRNNTLIMSTNSPGHYKILSRSTSVLCTLWIGGNDLIPSLVNERIWTFSTEQEREADRQRGRERTRDKEREKEEEIGKLFLLFAFFFPFFSLTISPQYILGFVLSSTSIIYIFFVGRRHRQSSHLSILVLTGNNLHLIQIYGGIGTARLPPFTHHQAHMVASTSNASYFIYRHCHWSWLSRRT